jgi:hypothetical protein
MAVSMVGPPKNRLPMSQRKSDLGIPLPYTWLNPSTRPRSVLFLTPAPKPAPTLARAGMARHPPRRPPTPLNSSVPASEVPFQSPPRPDRGFCTSPERPPPGAPRIGPRASKRWYERFRAALVGPGALLVRWRSAVGSAALGHESLSYGLPGAFYGPSGREGTGTTPRRCSVTALG